MHCWSLDGKHQLVLYNNHFKPTMEIGPLHYKNDNIYPSGVQLYD